jgi:agmatine deiminase
MKSEFSVTPEFAPQKAVWLQWPTPGIGDEGVDERDFIPAFVEIERECRTEGEVHNIVLNKNAERIARQRLADGEVPLDNISFHIMPYDSCWIRDSGPIFVKKDGRAYLGLRLQRLGLSTLRSL